MTECQRQRAEKAIANFQTGGSSFQKLPELPGTFCENAKSTYTYGETITDNIASWVKNGFAAGPFDQPPMKLFRVNSILATKQNEKVRTILNVSLPKGTSLNDNVDESKMEKVVMTSARNFGYTLVEAGKGAWFAKTDMKDAYKNIPVPLNELRLQGFSWLGKFFVETRQIFGAKTAVSNFDIMGQTILEIAILKSGIPRRWVHRQLDDVPVTGPKNSKWCETFEKTYKEVCSKCGVKLANNCPKFDKAFSSTQYGKVLGIWFDSKHLRWSLPEEKILKTKTKIAEAFEKPKVNLLQMQKLMGSLNDICIMCPFLRGFRKPLYRTLGYLQRNPTVHIHLGNQAKKDLSVFFNFLCAKDPWFPIPQRPSNPPFVKMVFTSDAAGCSDMTSRKEKVGCASIGIDANGIIVYARQIFWELETLKTHKDGKGRKLGSKTTTLEFLGLLLPFIDIPEQLKNKHVLLQVDNISCLFAWENKHSREDDYASVLVRTLHLIASFLGSVVHVQHLPRMSSWQANLVDRMSRKSTTAEADEKLLNSFQFRKLPTALLDWMSYPSEDWNLATNLLEYVENICKI